jgi:hypothetical protein
LDDFIAPDEKDELGEPSSSLSADDVISAFLRDAGFLYFHEGDMAWHIFIGRTMTAVIKCGDAEVNGVRIFFNPQGPTDKELSSCTTIQGHIQELHFLKTEASFFVESPRPLSLDRSKITKESFPSQNPRWMVVVFPWKDSEKTSTVEFEPFLFEREE